MEADTVVGLPRPGGPVEDDPAPALLRDGDGARRTPSSAIEAEVAAFRAAGHAGRVDEAGRRRVVRHGHAPRRSIQTGIGPPDRGPAPATSDDRRRCARLLEGGEEGPAGHEGPAPSGPQGCGRAGLPAEVRAAEGQGRPTSTRSTRPGAEPMPRRRSIAAPPSTRRSTTRPHGLPGQGSWGPARPLRLPGRAPEARARHQSGRERVRHRAPSDRRDQGPPVTRDRARQLAMVLKLAGSAGRHTGAD
jgi:hypothetical protein